MNRFLITLLAILGTHSGIAVTATKEYVDRQDGATLRAANAYTDAHGAGMDTNAVKDIIHATVDGAARVLPPYLHALDFDDSYPADAAWYYALSDIGGACSSVHDGNAYSRNFDFPYDERAEFVVRMAAGPDRFASVGVSNVGTNLTEAIVTSGKPSRFYKALPGATVDGINERGVAANINVVPANGAEGTVWVGHEVNAVGGVRWVLDHATSAGMAASNLAAKVYIPDTLIRKGYSAHFMLADERETWIVEDGVARKVDGRAVLTNYRLFADDDPYGTGYERYDLLTAGGNITSAWFRAAYRRPFSRPTEFAAPGVGTHSEADVLLAWAEANIPQGAPESLTRNGKSWQTVHTSVYDISNRVLRVAVQERDDWYVFQVPSASVDLAPLEERIAANAAAVASQQSQLSQHTADTDNPHLVTAEQVIGLNPDSLVRVYPYDEHPEDEADWPGYFDLCLGAGAQMFMGESAYVFFRSGSYVKFDSGSSIILGDTVRAEGGAVDVTGNVNIRSPGRAYFDRPDMLRFRRASSPGGYETAEQLIARLAPPPGNYAVVSNAAMTAYRDATNYTDAAITPVAAEVASLESTVNAWQTYWGGDDVRVTITNYFGSTDLPRLYIEQRTNEVAMATNHYRVVWDETTRLKPITNAVAANAAAIAALDATKADRAWGNYDSHTGAAAPSDVASVSARGVVLGAGMAYQGYATNAGEMWLLTANEPQTVTVSTNGRFCIYDADGNAMIEIVKGDKRTVPASVAAVQKTPSTFEVTFNVVSATHPIIEVCDDLIAADWRVEGDAGFPCAVTWRGSSGAWVCDLAVGDLPQLFVRGSYEVGGESCVKIMGERPAPASLTPRVDALEDALGEISAALDAILEGH